MSEHTPTQNARRGCQVCWDLAFVRAHLRGGLQADHYLDLLRENEDDPTHQDGSAVRGWKHALDHAGRTLAGSPSPRPPTAPPTCACGHTAREHRGPMYALPTGSRGPGCSVCECSWLCVVPSLPGSGVAQPTEETQ